MSIVDRLRQFNETKNASAQEQQLRAEQEKQNLIDVWNMVKGPLVAADLRLRNSGLIEIMKEVQNLLHKEKPSFKIAPELPDTISFDPIKYDAVIASLAWDINSYVSYSVRDVEHSTTTGTVFRVRSPIDRYEIELTIERLEGSHSSGIRISPDQFQDRKYIETIVAEGLSRVGVSL